MGFPSLPKQPVGPVFSLVTCLEILDSICNINLSPPAAGMNFYDIFPSHYRITSPWFSWRNFPSCIWKKKSKKKSGWSCRSFWTRKKTGGKKQEPILVGGWTNPFEKYAHVKLDHETPRIGVKFLKWNRHRAIYDIGICVGESTNRGRNLPGLWQKPGCSVSMHGRIRVGYLKIGHPKRKPAFPTIHFQMLC